MSEENNKFIPPTGEQCSSNAVVYEDESQVHYALWYPQIGGYAGCAVVIIYKGNRTSSCFDIYVWHDGEFPFTHGNPAKLHHCDPEQLIRLGTKIKDLFSKSSQEKLK